MEWPDSDSTTDFETYAQRRFNDAGIRCGTDGRVNDLDVAWMAEEYGRIAERDGAE